MISDERRRWLKSLNMEAAANDRAEALRVSRRVWVKDVEAIAAQESYLHKDPEWLLGRWVDPPSNEDLSST